MLFTSFLLLVTIAIASGTPRSGPKSLRLPIRNSGSPTIGIRDDPRYGHHPLRTNATQKRYLSPYTVELSVGTPPQLVYPAIDLFANNLWLDPDCYSSFSIDACYANGKYNPDASTSAGDLDCSQPWEFSNSYSGASGCFVDDDIQFAGANLEDVQVGIASESWGQTAGRLGLGFGCRGEGDISLVDELKSQGLIATRQFSIALGSANPSAGTGAVDVGFGELLFSGLNTRKYAGKLRKMYSHPAPEGDPRYYVTLTAMGIFDPNNCIFLDVYEPTHRAFFDYTTIVSHLPSVYIQLLSEFFPDTNYTEGVYQVPCSYRSHEASVDFYFDTHTISVPLRDFILGIGNICFLGAVENTEDEVILGQSFLRAAYTAFDLDDEAIYMAQYENCGDELINWDSSAAEEDGLCASRPSTLPASCYMTSVSASATSTTSSATATHSTSHSTTTASTHHYSTRTSRTSISHLTSTSRSTSHAPTRTSTSYQTTSSTSSSTHSTYWPRITSTSTHSSASKTSSHQTSSSRFRISSTTGANHTTESSPRSSGLPSGGSSIPWSSQPSTGFSWSNASFTPGTTNRWTPTPTSTLTSLPASTSYSSETSTLTSLPASTSSSSTTTHRSGGMLTRESEDKTVTVTVGIFTSTIFMPSPITVTREDLSSCDAVTEYRTRTVSHCRDGEQTTTADVGLELEPAMLSSRGK
ncbi:aspartic peptidase domain-containing protein [Xylaria cubensis]|nr:aspartic peptidase domain-containing protein [Xylaria cubensis]